MAGFLGLSIVSKTTSSLLCSSLMAFDGIISPETTLAEGFWMWRN